MDTEEDALFEDKDFDAADSALFSDYTTPLSGLVGKVTWIRPQQICKHPRLLPENPSEAYPKQGILGDCWLLCACTMLLKSRHLLDQVMPPGQCAWGEEGYCGEFRFHFWRNGQWTEVRVDDRLPSVSGTLCFSRCLSPTAFWVALLEKAYAKLHGSYESLWAGQVCEAMVDLSGGIAERWSLKRAVDNPVKRSLFLELSEGIRDQSYISCCVHSTGSSELGQFHALSVMEWTDVKTSAGEQVRLLRIQNPWGRRCWGGAWTESGEGWRSLDPSCSADLLGRTQEGEFWVDETEFKQEFDEVTVGYPFTEDLRLQSIYTGSFLTHSQQIFGRWVKGHSAGGCRNNSSYGSNPKFWLRVEEGGEVLLSLLQYRMWRVQRCSTQQPAESSSTQQHLHYRAIALHVWKVDKKRFNLARTLNSAPVASSHTHAYEREVVVHTHLSAGFHLLVPSTFLQGAEGHFLLRVHSTCPSYLSAVKVCVQEFVGGEWEMVSVGGRWAAGSTAGGGRNFPSHGQNPHVPFTVTYDPGGNNVKVILRQHGQEDHLHAIGFHIYKVPDSEADSIVISSAVYPVLSCVPHSHSQEVSVQCRLPPAGYIIVPSTYQPDCSAEYTLTIAQRIQRKVLSCQERLGQTVQEVCHVSVMGL